MSCITLPTFVKQGNICAEETVSVATTKIKIKTYVIGSSRTTVRIEQADCRKPNGEKCEMTLIEPGTVTLQPGENTIELTVYGPFVVHHFGRENYIDVTIRLVSGNTEYDRCVVRLKPYSYTPQPPPQPPPPELPPRPQPLPSPTPTPPPPPQPLPPRPQPPPPELPPRPQPPPPQPSPSPTPTPSPTPIPIVCPSGTVLTESFKCLLEGGICEVSHPIGKCCCRIVRTAPPPPPPQPSPSPTPTPQQQPPPPSPTSRQQPSPSPTTKEQCPLGSFPVSVPYYCRGGVVVQALSDGRVCCKSGIGVAEMI